MADIKRYDPDTYYNACWMEECEDGDYVRYDDYDAELTKIKSALNHDRHERGKLHSKVNRMTEEIDRLTQQIADMAAWINAQCGGCVMNATTLIREYADWGWANRNKQDQRFGQYIFNKYGYEFGNSYNIEDKEDAYQLLLGSLIAKGMRK